MTTIQIPTDDLLRAVADRLYRAVAEYNTALAAAVAVGLNIRSRVDHEDGSARLGGNPPGVKVTVYIPIGDPSAEVSR